MCVTYNQLFKSHVQSGQVVSAISHSSYVCRTPNRAGSQFLNTKNINKLYSETKEQRSSIISRIQGHTFVRHSSLHFPEVLPGSPSHFLKSYINIQIHKTVILETDFCNQPWSFYNWTYLSSLRDSRGKYENSYIFYGIQTKHFSIEVNSVIKVN